MVRGFEEDLEGAKEQNPAVADRFTKGVWKVEPMEFYSLGKVAPFVGERLRYRSLKTFRRREEAYDRATGAHHRVPIRVVRAA